MIDVNLMRATSFGLFLGLCVSLSACPDDNGVLTTELTGLGPSTGTSGAQTGEPPTTSGGDPVTSSTSGTTPVDPDTGSTANGPDPATPGTTAPDTTDPDTTDTGTTAGTATSDDTTTTGVSTDPPGTTTNDGTTTTLDSSTSDGTTSSTTDGTTSTTGDPPEMCMQGDKKPCYTGPVGTQDVGICAGGFRYCPNGMTYDPVCKDQVIPVAEQCNGADENCDGDAETLLGPPITVGTGKFPRLIAHNGQFVAAWVDQFNKLLLQRLDVNGQKIGAAVPLIINGSIHDIELASYAGGIGLVYAMYDSVQKTYVSYARSYDATLAPLAAEQRLGLAYLQNLAGEVDLVAGGIGGGSALYHIVEATSTVNTTTLRIVSMPQGQPGQPVPTTVWAMPADTLDPKVLNTRLIPTDYGIVGVYPSSLKHQMRGWGPAGNMVWDGATKDIVGAIVASNYNGDDIVVTGTFSSPSYYRSYTNSATDGAQKVMTGPTKGLFIGETYGGMYGDNIYFNGNHHSYGCINYQLAYRRFNKDGTFVPYESKVLPPNSCGKPNIGIKELRLAALGGTLVLFYVDGVDIVFRPQLCG